MTKINMSEYLRDCLKKGIIVSKDQMHGGSINFLCASGKFSPVKFTAFDGITRVANCLLTAEEFLKLLGQYKQIPGNHVPEPYRAFEPDKPVIYHK